MKVKYYKLPRAEIFSLGVINYNMEILILWVFSYSCRCLFRKLMANKEITVLYYNVLLC